MSRGIIHELSCPFTPEQNGRVEREMRTLSEAVTTVLVENDLDKKFWAEAMAYVVFTLNRVGKSSVENKTLYELFYNRGVFDIKMLRPFGSRCVVQIPNEKRKKFDAKGTDGMFVGYPPDSKGYKVWSDTMKKIITSRNVVFVNEDKFEEKPQNLHSQAESEDTEVVEIDYDWDEPDTPEVVVNLFNMRPPETYQDIENLKQEERDLWKLAVSKELDSIKRNNVWEPVPLQNQKLVDTKWIFRVKDTESGPKAKARLVARGFQSKEFNETYAPVASITSVRIFLSAAVHKGMKIKQLDVETAFLNGTLEEEVYIKPPQGYEVSKGVVLKLKKALYGLKQAPRSWYATITGVLERNGFRRSESEYCLYVKSCDLFLIIYVDDILIAGSSLTLVEEVISLLSSHFSIRIMDKIENFIGLHLQVDREQLKIDQTSYIESCAQRFQVENAKPVKTPMEIKLDLSKSNSNKDNLCVLKFPKLLGAVNYVMERSRPDVNFPVNALSRHTLSADEEKYRYLVRVLNYLNSTKELSLVYHSNQDAAPLTAYSDASWASEQDRKSTSGYVVLVFDNLVHYKTRKQSLVALSTAESEYIALSECAREVMWIKNVLTDMELNVGSSVIYVDNQAALKLAASSGNYNRIKHIDLKYHFIKDLVSGNFINLCYVNTNDNLADMFTKVIPKCKLDSAMKNLCFE